MGLYVALASFGGLHLIFRSGECDPILLVGEVIALYNYFKQLQLYNLLVILEYGPIYGLGLLWVVTFDVLIIMGS